MGNKKFGIVLAIVVVAVGIGYRRSRQAALCCLWVLWLVMPFIRRLFGLIGPLPEYDPLSVLPFVATLGVSLIELTRISVGLRLGRILLLACVGIVLGIPPAETRRAPSRERALPLPRQLEKAAPCCRARRE